ncbi:protein RFT1 homolog [Paramacrobiotus metropolitanus]|uniref:protein RFT1 homolog n=1 Tax=Paramacrobiotus metropolitanus TaxID=2943436 RepID=UPI002445928B|nr:protein RFT1 homolog [Paramacrobiotus metropolitanus]
MEVSEDLTSVFSGTVTSTYYHIILQIFCKFLTFALNGLVLRYISKDLLGIVNVRLLLLHTTILFLCREGIRRATSGNIRPEEWKQTVNLIWLANVFSCLLTFVGSMLWIFLMENPDAPFYAFGVVAYGLSSVIEMTVEPMYVLAQEMMFLKLRIMAKFLSMTIQSSINAVLIIMAPQYGILIFAVSHLIGSFVYCIVFYHYIKRLLHPNQIAIKYPINSIADFLPSRTAPIFPERLWQLTLSFTWQSFLKQILTEGEKFIMSCFQLLTFAEQGVYDVVNNLGSLVARLLFQQVEENAYVLFSKVLSRDPGGAEVPSESDKFGAKMLEVYLKSISALSIIIVLFGYHYSDRLFMSVYDVLSQTLSIISFGVRYNQKLVALSATFLLFSWSFVKQFGPVGFILANILNMALRILHSVHFIFTYYKDTESRPLHGVLVNSRFLAAAAVVSMVVYFFRRICDISTVVGLLGFLAIGGILGIFMVLVLWTTEKEMITFLYGLLRKKSTKAE